MIGAVILAAGSSSRLGEPKQLLAHGGETLIRHAVRAALETDCAPVVVVTGAWHERVEHELRGLPASVCHHPEWQLGMGSSIRAGLSRALGLAPLLDALLLMVCDQPFITSQILRALISARDQSGKRAAACVYSDAVGVPALFDRALFPMLAALPDAQGAKPILSVLRGEVARVPFPEGAIDIDTPAQRRQHLDPSVEKAATL